MEGADFSWLGAHIFRPLLVKNSARLDCFSAQFFAALASAYRSMQECHESQCLQIGQLLIKMHFLLFFYIPFVFVVPCVSCRLCAFELLFHHVTFLTVDVTWDGRIWGISVCLNGMVGA